MPGSVHYNGFNNSRHEISNVGKDKRVFSRSSDMTNWWNVTSWVPRGGRRF